MFFRQNIPKCRQNYPGGRGRVHSHVNFSPSALSPGRSASLHALGEFYLPLPLPLPLPRYTSLERRRKREIRIYRVVTFPNMNGYIKDLVITQRKTHSEVSLLLKERFPDKKGLSSRSVRRFCLKNRIHLHNRLSNNELEQCTRDVVAGVSKSFFRPKCLLFTIFFFFLPSFPCLHRHLYEHPSGFKSNFSGFSVNL